MVWLALTVDDSKMLAIEQNTRPVHGEYKSQCLSFFSPFGESVKNAKSLSFLFLSVQPLTELAYMPSRLRQDSGPICSQLSITLFVATKLHHFQAPFHNY